MDIAVNTRLLIGNRLDGIGWFSYETLLRITRAHPEHRFFFLFDRPWSGQFVFSENVIPLVVPPPTRHPLLWHTWLEYSLPRVFRKHRPELFLSPDGFLSLRSPVPSLPVIHDLNFEHRPADLPWLTGRYYRHYFPRFARHATRIATVSEYSKNDLVSSYGLDPDKIDVVYNGASEVFTPPSQEEQDRTRAQYTGGEPYFIFIGSLHPRKNIPNLLRAFDLFSRQQDPSVHLLIAGETFFKNRETHSVLSGMRSRQQVHFTGRLGREDLRMALGSSLALVFVPWFEGFGIPVLEAMACEVPVLASRVTSLPEVCGEAALLVDPANPEAMAASMGRLAADPELRQELVRKGIVRRRKFSWDQTAEKLWSCIEKTLA